MFTTDLDLDLDHPDHVLHPDPKETLLIVTWLNGHDHVLLKSWLLINALQLWDNSPLGSSPVDAHVTLIHTEEGSNPMPCTMGIVQPYFPETAARQDTKQNLCCLLIGVSMELDKLSTFFCLT